MCHNQCQSRFANRELDYWEARVGKPDQIGKIQVISWMLKLFWHYVWVLAQRLFLYEKQQIYLSFWSVDILSISAEQVSQSDMQVPLVVF